SRKGQLKRLAVAELRSCERGDLGQIGLRFSQRDDQLIDLCGADGPLVSVLAGERHQRLDPRLLTPLNASEPGEVLPLPGDTAIAALLPLLSEP
ncbi:MAG: topoisomerase IV, partial [Cyanobium sp.]